MLTGMLAAALAFGAFGCSTGTTGQSSTGADQEAQGVKLNIQAAASLTDAMNEVTAKYTDENPNVTFTTNYDASGTLQTQIEQGAPADLFISAAKKNMDALEEKGLLLEGTRKDLLGNTLVIVVPNDSTLGIKSIADLANPAVKVVALGDPETVPAGKYAKQSLEAADIYDTVKAKAVLGKDVKAVLTYAETGDADAGMVYKTDALVSTAATTAAEVADDTHDPIVYPAAVIKASPNQDASKAFLEYLSGPEATAIFEKYGFKTVR